MTINPRDAEQKAVLPLNELFDTIQGEAHYTGTPSTFVRLQGCGVGCPWCDTKHTWPVNLTKASDLYAVLDKQQDDETFAWLSPSHLTEIIGLHKPRHVVITGGEPCVYDLRELTTQLFQIGKMVQIETSGTAEVHCDFYTWVTVSPKFDMPGGLQVLDQALDRADEIKMPVGKMADIERVKALEDRNWKTAHMPIIWLQPLSKSPKATELCLEQAMLNGWRVSIQTHKFIGVR